MPFEFAFLAIIAMITGFIAVIINVLSTSRFLESELKNLLTKVTMAIIFIYLSVLAQGIIEIYDMHGSLFEYPKYIFTIMGFWFFLWSAIIDLKLSKTLGFAAKELPEKLKKILK